MVIWCAMGEGIVKEFAHLFQGPGQVGLYELPTIIAKSTQNYDFVLISS